MLKRIGARPVQSTVTLAQSGSRFGAFEGEVLRLLVAVFVLEAPTGGVLLAAGATETVAVMVLDTKT
jgi:hypothetical protein